MIKEQVSDLLRNGTQFLMCQSSVVLLCVLILSYLFYSDGLFMLVVNITVFTCIHFVLLISPDLRAPLYKQGFLR